MEKPTVSYFVERIKDLNECIKRKIIGEDEDDPIDLEILLQDDVIIKAREMASRWITTQAQDPECSNFDLVVNLIYFYRGIFVLEHFRTQFQMKNFLDDELTVILEFLASGYSMGPENVITAENSVRLKYLVVEAFGNLTTQNPDGVLYLTQDSEYIWFILDDLVESKCNSDLYGGRVLNAALLILHNIKLILFDGNCDGFLLSPHSKRIVPFLVYCIEIVSQGKDSPHYDELMMWLVDIFKGIHISTLKELFRCIPLKKRLSAANFIVTISSDGLTDIISLCRIAELVVSEVLSPFTTEIAGSSSIAQIPASFFSILNYLADFSQQITLQSTEKRANDSFSLSLLDFTVNVTKAIDRIGGDHALVDCFRILANLTYLEKENGAECVNSGVLHIILKYTNDNVENPVISMWATMCIRNMCEQNEENRRRVSELLEGEDF